MFSNWTHHARFPLCRPPLEVVHFTKLDILVCYLRGDLTGLLFKDIVLSVAFNATSDVFGPQFQ